MDKYKDPKNTEEITGKLLDSKTHVDVLTVIMDTFPGWVIGLSQKYSEDYRHLQQNWLQVCDKIGTKPTGIVIVDFIDFKNDDYKLLSTFCELMTQSGYCVRRKEEFVACTKCKSAIPTMSIWKKMKGRGLDVPSSWSKKCRKC